MALIRLCSKLIIEYTYMNKCIIYVKVSWSWRSSILNMQWCNFQKKICCICLARGKLKARSRCLIYIYKIYMYIYIWCSTHIMLSNTKCSTVATIKCLLITVIGQELGRGNKFCWLALSLSLSVWLAVCQSVSISLSLSLCLSLITDGQADESGCMYGNGFFCCYTVCLTVSAFVIVACVSTDRRHAACCASKRESRGEREWEGGLHLIKFALRSRCPDASLVVVVFLDARVSISLSRPCACRRRF